MHQGNNSILLLTNYPCTMYQYTIYFIKFISQSQSYTTNISLYELQVLRNNHETNVAAPTTEALMHMATPMPAQVYGVMFISTLYIQNTAMLSLLTVMVSQEQISVPY